MATTTPTGTTSDSRQPRTAACARLPLLMRRQRCERMTEAVQGLHYAGHEIRVHSIRWANMAPRRRVGLHRHSSYEALVVLRGGGWDLQPVRRSLSPGCVQFHLPNERHSWESGDDGLECFGIWFSLERPVPVRDDWQKLRLPSAAADVATTLQEADRDDAGSLDRLRARLLLALAPLLDLLDWPALANLQPQDNIWTPVTAVTRFLEDNLGTPVSLQDVAWMANVSVPTLNRIFRREANESVMKRLERLRMEHAAMLLRDTDLPIKIIAARIACATPNYFSRRFRRFSGLSPIEYRCRDARTERGKT